MDRVLPSINGEFISHVATPSATFSQVRFLVWTFFALAALDIAVNAAAGPAAVATACHVNGSPLTARALQLGALAGVTKSGVLAFVEFLGCAGLPTPAWMLLLLFASSFGICVLVTAEISNLVLGESKFRKRKIRKDHNNVFLAPGGLLIAAVVAAIPLGGECIGIYQCELPPACKLNNSHNAPGLQK